MSYVASSFLTPTVANFSNAAARAPLKNNYTKPLIRYVNVKNTSKGPQIMVVRDGHLVVLRVAGIGNRNGQTVNRAASFVISAR